MIRNTVYMTQIGFLFFSVLLLGIYLVVHAGTDQMERENTKNVVRQRIQALQQQMLEAVEDRGLSHALLTRFEKQVRELRAEYPDNAEVLELLYHVATLSEPGKARQIDGQAQDSEYAKQFGIQMIPALWMVDIKGHLRYINGLTDLSHKVERLLAERGGGVWTEKTAMPMARSAMATSVVNGRISVAGVYLRRRGSPNGSRTNHDSE